MRKTNPNRLAAKEQGLNTFVGNTCKKCGTDVRYTRDSRCRECFQRNCKEYHKNSSKWRSRWLKNKYNISESEYDGMMVQQKFSCAICGTNECSTGRQFAVDHCHDTGKVRGLLCTNCNTALGGFKDDVKLLKEAIKYLEIHNEAGCSD